MGDNLNGMKRNEAISLFFVVFLFSGTKEINLCVFLSRTWYKRFVHADDIPHLPSFNNLDIITKRLI